MRVLEEVPASRMLNIKDALVLLNAATRLLVAKGNKHAWHDVSTQASQRKDLASMMLGPTGNLRAPTLVVGDCIIVGFHAEAYEAFFC